MDCKDFEQLYWLWAYGEAIPGGEDGLLQHLESCPTCQARREELYRLRELLRTRTSPVLKPEALAQARQRLAARLRAEERPGIELSGNRWREGLRRWFAPRWQPAYALGALLLGLVIGRIIYYSPAPAPDRTGPIPWRSSDELKRREIAENILKDDSQITDLRIRPLNPQTGLMQVSFRGIKDYQVQGRPEDELIRGLLTWAVKNESNSGARLESVEGLARASSLSSMAREALAYALINDKNDGVRLRALEALGSAPRDHLIEQAILDALLNDSNPAVRIRAIDVLLTDEVMDKSESLLLHLAEADSNDYVRMRARNAIRQSDFPR